MADKRPEGLWAALLILVLFAQVACLAMARTSTNVTAAVLGMFVSIGVLAFFRSRDTQRRADGRYQDWQIVSASTAVNLLTMVCWFLGVANVFFVAQGLTR